MKKMILALGITAIAAAVHVPQPGMSGLPNPPFPPLPPLLIPAPPPVVLIPGTYAYFAPKTGGDLIFFQGYWYRPHWGKWYRASHYNGPWGGVEIRKLPKTLVNLPSGYRDVPPGRERIPYGHLQKNWKTWEREKHWDKKEKRNKHRGRDRRDDYPDAGRKRGHGRRH